MLSFQQARFLLLIHVHVVYGNGKKTDIMFSLPVQALLGRVGSAQPVKKIVYRAIELS